MPKNGQHVDDNSFGPMMLALTMQERLFVAFLFTNGANASKAARDAGLTENCGSPQAVRVKAYRMMHRTDIKQAIIEESQRRSVVMLPKLELALGRMIGNSQHIDHFKAVKLGYDLAGVQLAKKIEVDMQISIPEEEKMTQMRAWAAEMALKGVKINLDELLGISGPKTARPALPAPTEKPIADAEFQEVEDWEDEDVSALA